MQKLDPNDESEFAPTLPLRRAEPIEAPVPTLADSVWLRVVLAILIATMLAFGVALGKVNYDIDRLIRSVERMSVPGQLRRLP